jgi:hypothetical protein
LRNFACRCISVIFFIPARNDYEDSFSSIILFALKRRASEERENYANGMHVRSQNNLMILSTQQENINFLAERLKVYDFALKSYVLWSERGCCTFHLHSFNTLYEAFSMCTESFERKCFPQDISMIFSRKSLFKVYF